MRTLYLLVALAVACGEGKPRVAGFNPPPIEKGEVEYDSPIIKDIKPGTDVTYCSYLDAHITDESDITHFRVAQSAAGHHVILYAARHSRPVDTHECTEDDMVNARFLAAGGGESVGQLLVPDGLAFRIPAGTQLMMQTHWINATRNTVDGEAVAYLTTVPSSPKNQVLDLFNVVLTDFTMNPGEKLTKSTTCTLPRDLQLYTLTGHEHALGSHVDIDLLDGANAPKSLWSHDWQPSFTSDSPYNIYPVQQPLLLKSGQQVRVTCTWINSKTDPVTFPSEMCVGSGFYFPSVDGEIDCVDGVWP
jgi:hypothetical protein